MSLFGSKKKVSVFSAAAPLMHTDPDATKNAVLYAILKKQPIGATIVDTYLQGMGVKVDAAMVYARNEYALGLPNNYHSSVSYVSDSVLADVIKRDLSLPYGCIVKYNFIAPVYANTAVVPFLVDTRGYHGGTEEISILPPGWALPDEYNGVAVFPQVFVDSAVLQDDNVSVLITYRAILHYGHASVADGTEPHIHQVPTTEYQETYSETVTIPAGIALGKTYYVAGYSRLDSVGAASEHTDWWYYSMDSDKYPELSPAVAGSEVHSYPVIPLRYENQSISPTNSPDVYSTGKQLLKRMGVEMDVLIDTLEGNPDIADIDHAYVMFGVDLQTDNQVSLSYLVDFFTYLADADDTTVWDRLSGVTGKSNTYSFGSHTNTSGTSNTSTDRSNPTSGAIINTQTVNPIETLRLTEHGLKISLDYDRIESYFVTGSVGDVGTVTKEIKKGDKIWVGTGDNRQAEVGPDKLTLRKQVATNQYQEVVVVGLVHQNHVYRSHSITTTPTDVLESADEHNLVIPLHMGVVRGMPLKYKNELYQESFLLIINAYEITKVKWYQTGIFKVVMLAVAVVISVASGQAWVTGLVTAMEAGIAALAIYILETVLISIAVHYASVAIAKEIGPEWAMVLAVVTMAISRKFSGTFTMFGDQIPTAEAFLFAGQSLMGGANEALNQLIEDVDEESNEFSVDSEAQMTVLEEKQKLLDTEFLLPFSYLEPPFNHPKPDVDTAPGQFYDKIHTGNIGTLALDVIENYSSIALLLPEPELLT